MKAKKGKRIVRVAPAVKEPLAQHIQIVFVAPDGTKTNGPLIDLPKKRMRIRKLNDAAWDQNEAIRKFCLYFGREDRDGLEASMRALNRLDCWRQAVEHLMTGPSPNIAKAHHLFEFWNTYGLHSVGRGLREDLPVLVDAFKYLLPPYMGGGLKLYRGEVESRHLMETYGISWTPIVSKAKAFADMRGPDEGRGVIIEIYATPDMIVAAVRDYFDHTLKLGEDEYIVDPRMIDGKAVVIYTAPDED